MIRQKKVLVTGAGGFIGSRLTEKLSYSGYKVKAFIHYNSMNSWGWLDSSSCKERIEVISGDIRDADIVRYAMGDVEIIFHLAALIGIPYSYYSPEAYVDTNIKGTLNILQSALDFGVKKVVLTSTSEVYGTAQFIPIAELHPINPQSPYAASKSAADLLGISFYKSFNLPVVIIRPFNTFGPRQSARAVIPTIITQILAGFKKISLGSVESTRDLLYIEDTVNGIIKAGESINCIGETVNLCSKNGISIRDLTRLIARIMDVKIRIKEDADRKRPIKSEVDRLIGDNSKAKKFLKWSPEYSLEKGLKKTVEWFKENIKEYKPEIYNI